MNSWDLPGDLGSLPIDLNALPVDLGSLPIDLEALPMNYLPLARRYGGKMCVLRGFGLHSYWNAAKAIICTAAHTPMVNLKLLFFGEYQMNLSHEDPTIGWTTAHQIQRTSERRSLEQRHSLAWVRFSLFFHNGKLHGL